MINFAVQPEEAEMITNFRALTETQKKLIFSMIQSLSHDTAPLVVVAGSNVTVLHHPTPRPGAPDQKAACP